MTTPTARLLPDGQRLHLQHGPSDLVVWAEGARDRAYRAAVRRFETVIAEIVEELPALRERLTPATERPRGDVARRMHDACNPVSDGLFVTRMAAVAGAVADEVLDAMRSDADITRAYVNNGGDIALHLTSGTSFRTAVKGHDGCDLGRIVVAHRDGVGGIATSGRHGRSLSRGIADSVTALAGSAAAADVAATLIANAVDLPGHPAISRRKATDIDEASDLGSLPVVTACGRLSHDERARALGAGQTTAEMLQSRGLIASAALFLQGQTVGTDPRLFPMSSEIEHANA